MVLTAAFYCKTSFEKSMELYFMKLEPIGDFLVGQIREYLA